MATAAPPSRRRARKCAAVTSIAAPVTIYEGYGLSAGPVGASPSSQFNDLIRFAGKPVPGNDLLAHRRRDGELLVRGGVYSAATGATKRATTEAFTDSWFKTGDLRCGGRRRGFLTITGRKVSSPRAVNVAAVLEDQLRAHPLISQAVVVGAPSPSSAR